MEHRWGERWRVVAELCRPGSKKGGNCRHGLCVYVGCTGDFEGEADVFPPAGDGWPVKKLVWGKSVMRSEGFDTIAAVGGVFREMEEGGQQWFKGWSQKVGTTGVLYVHPYYQGILYEE